MIIQHGKNSRFSLTSQPTTSLDNAGMPKVLSATAILLDQFDSVFDGKAWHGPTLRGALRGLTAQEAGQPLTQAGHSIADIALHCAYWKYSVRRRLLQSPRGAFTWKGSNWFTLPRPLPEEEWKKILKTLDAEHDALRQAITSFPEARLEKTPRGSKFNFFQLIQGIAAHDVFHAGQIRLLKPRD